MHVVNEKIRHWVHNAGGRSKCPFTRSQHALRQAILFAGCITSSRLPYQLIGKYVVGHDADVGEDWVLVACAGLHIRACQWLLALSINQKRIATSVLQAAFL